MASASNFFSSSWSSLRSLSLLCQILFPDMSLRPLLAVLSYSYMMRNNSSSPRGRGHLLFVHWNRTK